MTQFPDMTKLMNPQWARWFDTIKNKTGDLNLAQARKPAMRGLETLARPAQQGFSTDDLVDASTASRQRSRTVSQAALGANWNRF